MINERLEEVNKRIKADPHDLEAWHEKVEIFIQASDNEALLKTYDEMLANNQTYVEALIFKAEWLGLVMNKSEEALECFTKAVALDPKNDEVLSYEKRLKNEKTKTKS